MTEEGGHRNRRGPHAPFLLGALGALGALLLVRNKERLRPHLRGALRELFTFKDWLTFHAQRAREDFDDVAAEARRECEDERERRARRAEREAARAAKVERVAKRRTRRVHGG